MKRMFARLIGLDEWVVSGALALMLAIPLLEIALRPLLGKGIENAPVLVQHLGLLLAMFGAVMAERGGHLSSLGSGFGSTSNPQVREAAQLFARSSTALCCGLLAQASWTFVISEMEAPRALAYGLQGWWIEAAMPLGFLLLGMKQASRLSTRWPLRFVLAIVLPGLGFLFAQHFDGSVLPLWPFVVCLLAALFCGAPIFAVLGALSLALFWQEGQPLASVPLSHYQITVNPSLPALPLFTLAGLIFARTGAAQRLGALFTALFGTGVTGTALAAAVLCSFFTAFTGGSGVTILALGGLLLPLLTRAGFPEQRGIGLVTSASALGVLLAPSVPLIMYAIIARVPINDMFLAGVLPAGVMVISLLVFGGFLKSQSMQAPTHRPDLSEVAAAAWAARWEILAPVVAIVSLVGGLATPTESAALTAAYALLTQAVAHKELDWPKLRAVFANCGEIIGGIMLILGMALGLTNFLVDAGVPDAAIEWVQSVLPNKFAFLIALNVFLLIAGALMEIYAAIVVLVPLLLPVALAYGIDPLHFGVIFLANIEMGFLCPPAGMNIYFASAMFRKPIRYVGVSVLPALLAILIGVLVISALPFLATGLPVFFSTAP
ncbi:TRAP transporter large permease subunit [Uliginosibacterium sp. TH139]|uniref:TRAP transporter large permease n=1 Tax=Uliginosibacterium sp. TH139 TaxID=2067453 RepID=UPI000C7B0D2E|nr:TRAP transporter large permease subunit [Uliginosibacterium sp. TH139]PLK48210.1 C4-dicarboxylate ABC transporter permease [Uliginosibacterium sp. TH139]